MMASKAPILSGKALVASTAAFHHHLRPHALTTKITKAGWTVNVSKPSSNTSLLPLISFCDRGITSHLIFHQWFIQCLAHGLPSSLPSFTPALISSALVSAIHDCAQNLIEVSAWPTCHIGETVVVAKSSHIFQFF